MRPSPLAELLSDRYRIERELGAGGTATVYLAEDMTHRRTVAVKVRHPELTAVLGSERFLHGERARTVPDDASVTLKIRR